MRSKNSHPSGVLVGLIPFVALPLFIGCQNNLTGPDGRPDHALLAQEPAFESPGPRLLLAPGAAELAVGESLQFRRYWQDEADTYDDPDKTVQWASSDPAVAAVNQDGLVQALRKGTVIINAQGDGGPGSALSPPIHHSDDSGSRVLSTVDVPSPDPEEMPTLR